MNIENKMKKIINIETKINKKSINKKINKKVKIIRFRDKEVGINKRINKTTTKIKKLNNKQNKT